MVSEENPDLYKGIKSPRNGKNVVRQKLLFLIFKMSLKETFSKSETESRVVVS